MAATQSREYRKYFPEDATEEDVSRQRISKLLHLRGYAVSHESLVILEDHFASTNNYTDLVDFINKLNYVISFQTDLGEPVITPELAYKVTQKLNSSRFTQNLGHQLSEIVTTADSQTHGGTNNDDCAILEPEIPENPSFKVKNVACQDDTNEIGSQLNSVWKNPDQFHKDDFEIHYNFLIKKLGALPVFSGDYSIVKLSTLTGSTQPSIRCLCFGLLIKDLSKIDGYTLIDSSGRVPLRITADTIFRNRLAYCNTLVLVEGVYINPDDVLFAANIGLPPILLDPIPNKTLACTTNKMVILLKEIYLDDSDVLRAIEQLFTGYNSMDEPPLSFILIGDFIRDPPTKDDADRLRRYMKKLAKIIVKCDNLKQSHIVIVPGPNDVSYEKLNIQANVTQSMKLMPKRPLNENVACLRLLRSSGFEKVQLATNPSHINIGDRLISVISHSYIKQIRKSLIHDLTDHREEFYNIIQRIMLSNAHFTSGVSKRFHSSLKLWHRPDLLVLADTEAFGNRYDWSSSKDNDTSFATLPSFTRQSSQFKVYCIKSGELEDSQVTYDNQDHDEYRQHDRDQPDEVEQLD